MTDFTEFKFDRETICAPRPPGISAYLRVKNGAEFVRLAIESHLPFYDEIVAVYNDCTDDTPEILRDLQQQHPDKIKVFHYLPKVATARTERHKVMPDDSVHGLANYYNFALSKTTYNTAAKLDDDHLAIPHKLAPAIKTIRADIAKGIQKNYLCSGINLHRDKNLNIACSAQHTFGGNDYDHLYHTVNAQTYFRNSTRTQSINKPYIRTLPTDYMGILYFHLKGLKKEFAKQNKTQDLVSFDEFCSPQFHRRLLSQLNWYERKLCALYKNEKMQRLKYKWTKTPPRFNQLRLARLAEDLHGIDFVRDVEAWLP